MKSSPRPAGLAARVWRHTWISLCCLMVVLVIVEIVLQFVMGNLTVAPFQIVSDGRCIGLAPGQSVEYTGTWLRIPPIVHEANEQGFRGPQRSVEKPPGTKRISVVGDSWIYGMGVRSHEAIAAQLESVLREKGHPVEVLNFGIPGLDFFSALDQMEHFALRWQTDLVIFQISEAAEDKCDILSNRVGSWFTRNIRLARFVFGFFKAPAYQAERRRHLLSETLSPTFLTGLRRLKGLADGAQVQLAVLIFREPEDDMTNLTTACRDLGIPWLELDWIQIPNIPKEWHFSPEGNRVVASMLAESVVVPALFD